MMNRKRLSKGLGFGIGCMATELYLHSVRTYAMGVELDTAAERISAVGFGILVLLLLMVLFQRMFSSSFFHGFVVATGLFLSFDIVVFHWVFQLHRITSGPEANWLEPIFVLIGCLLFTYAMKKEKQAQYQDKAIEG